jgi:hypothetical protein
VEWWAGGGRRPSGGGGSCTGMRWEAVSSAHPARLARLKWNKWVWARFKRNLGSISSGLWLNGI